MKTKQQKYMQPSARHLSNLRQLPLLQLRKHSLVVAVGLGFGLRCIKGCLLARRHRLRAWLPAPEGRHLLAQLLLLSHGGDMLQPALVPHCRHPCDQRIGGHLAADLGRFLFVDAAQEASHLHVATATVRLPIRRL